MRDWLAAKSLKREVAFGCLVFWMVLTHRLFWAIDPAHVGVYTGPYGAVTFSVFGVVAGAFGLQHLTKDKKP